MTTVFSLKASNTIHYVNLPVAGSRRTCSCDCVVAKLNHRSHR